MMTFTVCMKVSYTTSVFDTRVMGDTVGRIVPDEQDHAIRTGRIAW